MSQRLWRLLAILILAFALPASLPADEEGDENDDDEEPGVSFQLDIDYFDSQVFGGSGPQHVEESRKRAELSIDRKLAPIDWACNLTGAQKEKLKLAGRGDIDRLFRKIGEHRKSFERKAVGKQDINTYAQLCGEAQAAKSMLDAGPFLDDSLFVKTLKKSLTGEQGPKYEALCAVKRVGGRVKTQVYGKDTLRELDLNVSRCADAELAVLGDLTNVQVLKLDSTRITDAGLVHIARLTDLEELDLGSTQVTDAGLVHLKGFDKLRVLNLRSTETTDTGLASLKRLTRLRHLALFGTHISDRGMEEIKELKNLEALSLGSTPISDAGLSKIVWNDLVRLEELRLDGTRVTDAGLKNLAGLRSLQVLDLRNTPITDAGLIPLRRMTTLRELYLTNTEVSDSAADDLRQASPDLKIYK